MEAPAKYDTPTVSTALEKAAKFICTTSCGLCPHVVVQHPCPIDCTLNTMAWECWMRYFIDQAKHSRPQENASQ